MDAAVERTRAKGRHQDAGRQQGGSPKLESSAGKIGTGLGE